MTEITKYVADDGTEFEFEDECLEYELKGKIRDIYGFIVYDCNGKEIKPDEYRDLDCFVSEARYIKVTDIKGWDAFQTSVKNKMFISMTEWMISTKKVFTISMMTTTIG